MLTGGFPALSGVSLTVTAGEIVLLQGANGAGKTTLLRLCGGLAALQSGAGTVLGLNLHTSRRELRRRVGFLGHSNALYGELTVKENLNFLAKAMRLDQRNIDEALELLAVSPRLHDVLVRELSAGQQKRLALAAVVMRRPELWLLDEPHAGLDSTARGLVDGLIGHAAAQGATVIVSSHEVSRNTNLATRRVNIAAGMTSANSNFAPLADSASPPTPAHFAPQP